MEQELIVLKRVRSLEGLVKMTTLSLVFVIGAGNMGLSSKENEKTGISAFYI